jgi:DNA-binding response OmpR family regulator
VLVISALRNGELALSLGATDYLVKPVDQDALHTMLSRLAKPEPASREAKILVIDDDPDLVPLLQMMLRDNHFTLIAAYDGEEGLAKAQSERPDGILLDLMMPGMSGFEVLDRLRAADETADTPVIVLTVKDVTGEEQAQLNDQIQTLMNKSALTPEALVDQLRTLKHRSGTA